MRMSKSKVLLYSQCPRKFQFRHILKIPEPMHPAARIGIDVHDICDKFFDKIDLNTKNAEEHFVQVIKQMTPIDACEKMILYLTNFCNYEIKRFNEMEDKTNYIPKFREVEFNMKEHNIKGFVDRIDKTPEGYVLLDYKTGVPKNMREHMYELSLYAKGVEEEKGIKIAKIGVLKLKNKNKILDLSDVSENDRTKALDLTLKVRQLVAEEEFDKNVGNHCFYQCPENYKSLCRKIDNGEIKHIVD